MPSGTKPPFNESRRSDTKLRDIRGACMNLIMRDSASRRSNDGAAPTGAKQAAPTYRISCALSLMSLPERESLTVNHEHM